MSSDEGGPAVGTESSATTENPKVAPARALGGRGALIVAGIFLAITIGALDQFVVVTALPKIATSLGSPDGVAFVVSAYLTSAAVGILVFGRLTSIYSHRKILLIGLLTFIVGSVLAGLSQNLGELIAFRTVQGFSGDSFIVVGFAIVADLFPPSARARITGLFTGSFVIATILGPFVGSYIVDNASWRWVFYVNVPVVLVAAGVLAFALPSLRSAASPVRFDAVGTALLTGWVSALTFALVQTSTGGWAWTDPRILACLASGLTLVVGFVLWERRTRDALLPARLFRSATLSASGVVSFFRGTALFAVYTFVAIYVGLVLAQGGPAAADHVRDVLYFLVVPAVVGAGVGSQFVTRVPYRPLMLGGLGLAVVGGLLLTQITASTPLWRLYDGFLPIGGLALPLIPMGLGVGITFPVTILAAQFSAPRADAGLATSVVEFTQTLGGAIGLSLLASFQQWRVTSLAPASPLAYATPASRAAYAIAFQHATLVSLQEVFGVTAALLVVCVVASWWLTGRLPESQGEAEAASVPVVVPYADGDALNARRVEVESRAGGDS